MNKLLTAVTVLLLGGAAAMAVRFVRRELPGWMLVDGAWMAVLFGLALLVATGYALVWLAGVRASIGRDK